MAASFIPRLPLRAAAAAASLVMLAPPALAQVKPDGAWRGNAGAAFAATSGNSSTTSLAFTADMVRATADDKTSLAATSTYGRSKAAGVSTTTANKWTGSGQYDFNLSPQLFAFGKLGLEGDELADLALRSTVAGGLGFKLVDSKPLAFTLFGGAAYTTDRYDSLKTVGSRISKTHSRSSLLLGEESVHALADNTSFKQRLELYPGLNGDKAVLAKFNAGLGVAVSSALNVNLSLVATHNSKPPVGVKRTDVGVFAGVNLRFGAN